MYSNLHGIINIRRCAHISTLIILLAAMVMISSGHVNAATPIQYPSDVHITDLENPEYQLKDINGNTVSTKAENNKPKILFFFNKGCGRCAGVEKMLQTYGVNTNKVDFVMIESTNEPKETAFDEDTVQGIDNSGQCYGSDAKEAFLDYKVACGLVDGTMDDKPLQVTKPVIIYISADNRIIGYSWSFNNIYTAAMSLDINLEKGGHHWEDLTTTVEEDGYASTYKRCAACRLERMHFLEIPEPATTEFAYNGKSHTLLPDTAAYTVTNGSAVAVGEYTAQLHIKDTGKYVWKDGEFRDSKMEITWTITKGTQTPKITTSSKTYKASSLKKSAQSFAIKVSGAKGTKSFKKISGSSKLTLNKTNGKITVKKGTAKGKYIIKVKVAAQGTSNYKPGTSAIKKITVTVK